MSLSKDENTPHSVGLAGGPQATTRQGLADWVELLFNRQRGRLLSKIMDDSALEDHRQGLSWCHLGSL